MKKIGVAILGLGTVGGGTYRILNENHDSIACKENLDIQVIKVLEKTVENALKKGVPADKVASNIDEIASNPDIDVVVETIGGIEPAKTFISKCLSSGKNVVTANKELISKHWTELEEIAKKHNCGLYFEASCLGGVPIIRSLVEGMQANNITELAGIFNGTTNYILTKMSEENMSYSDALAEAQSLGYAEADPTSDVEGYDTMYKLSILSTLAFRKRIPLEKIYREGITHITKSDIESGKELGYTIKLLAIGRMYNHSMEVRVHPAFVPNEHPLASVRGSFNAIHLVGNYVGEIMLYGKGAGDLPTGSAIVSDIIYCAHMIEPRYVNFECSSDDTNIITDFKSKYYMLINCVDKAGVLSQTTAVLGKHNVSIESVIQKGKHKEFARVVFLTHETSELSMMAAIEELKKLQVVDSVESVIRVLS
ncbi:MAG TPA: homoserine dehydrogenase [Clostridia bacterium]